MLVAVDSVRAERGLSTSIPHRPWRLYQIDLLDSRVRAVLVYEVPMARTEQADPTPFDPKPDREQATPSHPPDFVSFPTNSVAKEDLLSIRPDLEGQIQALDDNDLFRIANKVGDALSESYWTALPIILASYLGVPEQEDVIDDVPSEADVSHHRDDWETEALKDIDLIPPLDLTGRDADNKLEDGGDAEPPDLTGQI